MFDLDSLCSLLFRKLLRNKADINSVNEHGNTPLHYACFWGYAAVAEDLVNAGALVSIANKYNEIPLDKCKGHLAKKLHGTLSQSTSAEYDQYCVNSQRRNWHDSVHCVNQKYYDENGTVRSDL